MQGSGHCAVRVRISGRHGEHMYCFAKPAMRPSHPDWKSYHPDGSHMGYMGLVTTLPGTNMEVDAMAPKGKTIFHYKQVVFHVRFRECVCHTWMFWDVKGPGSV